LKIIINNKYEILDVEVLKRTNEENLVEAIKENNKKIIITFDYLDKGEGATIQVVHTGKSSQDINFIGKIKGAGRPKRIAILEEGELPKPYFSFRISIIAPNIITILSIFGSSILFFALAVKVISLGAKIFFIIMAIISFSSGISSIIYKGPPKDLVE